MTAMFAMVGNDHHALLDLFNDAGRHAALRLNSQGPKYLIGCYAARAPVSTSHISRLSLPRAEAVISACSVPTTNELAEQLANNPQALSNCIDGPHTAFLWSEEHDALFASRDPLNQQSLYFAHIGNSTVISSEAKFIAQLLPHQPRLNKAALACWLAGQPNPSLSLYEEINVLPIGDSLKVTAENKLSVKSFWNIDPHNTIDMGSDNQYANAFYALLQGAVLSHVSADEKVIVSQMSGGMDSTSITTLAHKLFPPTKEVKALSHLYSHSVSCDESDNIKAMYAALHTIDPIQVTVDAGAHRDFLSLYPTDFDSPGTVLSPRYHQECELILAAGSKRLLTGNGGDEMCWGHASSYTQRLKQREWSVVNEVAKACKAANMATLPVMRSLFIKPLIPECLLNLARKLKGHQLSELPAWLTPTAHNLATTASLVGNPFHPKKQPVGHARYQALKTTSTYNSMRSYQKVAWQYGIEVAHPFFDRRIAEFSFAIPAKQLIRGPYPKWILRKAMHGEMPNSVCWNINKVTFDNHFGQLVKDNAVALRQLLTDTRLEELGLVNNATLLAAFDNAISGSHAVVHVDLLYAILTQRWIQQHH